METGLSAAYADARRAAGTAARHAAYRERPLDWIVEHLGVQRHTLVWTDAAALLGTAVMAGGGVPGPGSLEGEVRVPPFTNQPNPTTFSLFDIAYPYTPERQWDGTPEPLLEILQGLVDWKDVGVESCTGSGKSFLAACIILWFLAVWQGSRIFTFAPTEKQLKLHIWAEVATMWPKFKKLFPNAQLLDLEIRMDAGRKWGAWGYAVGVKAGEDVAVSAAGMHAEHMLLIYEEMPGIPDPVIQTGLNTAIGPHNLRLGLGNPDHQQDTLHQFCIKPTTKHITVSAFDHPNIVLGRDVIPGAVSRDSVVKRVGEYGLDSPMYLRRIKGRSPEQAEEALIKREWLVRSALRWSQDAPESNKPPLDEQSLGVDVARSENGDKAAVCHMWGGRVVEIKANPCKDTAKLAVEAHLRASGRQIPHGSVAVDVIGVGGGTVDVYRQLPDGEWVFPFNASARPIVGAQRGDEKNEWLVSASLFRNLRSQAAWQLAEDFRLDRIDCPEEPGLWEELLTPQWYPRNGKIVLEEKEDIKRRLGGKSPNKFDALMMSNWIRKRSREVRVVVETQDRHVEYDVFKKTQIDDRKPLIQATNWKSGVWDMEEVR